MNILGMVLFILFMIVALGAFIKNVIDIRTIVKSPISAIDYKKKLKMSLIYNLIFAFSLLVSLSMIYVWNKISPLWWEVLSTVIFVPILGFSVSTFYTSFRLHYYKTSIPKEIDKWLYRAMLISIPLMLITIWYSFNGFARYLSYPLVNGISFTSGWTTPENKGGGFTLAFYALCILAGAVFVYFLCDHKLYQQYGKHGIIESTFLIAFPAGILGARIWYVIGNWKVDGFDKDPMMMFRIWEGGLTILGGAIMGIVVGVLWYMWRNKKYSIFVAVDVIVPTILLAQAIGRIGNFFNCEVHGNPVSVEAWQWLPMIITKNGMHSSTEITLNDGTFYLPLFLIEGVLNVGGYFVIASLFGKKFRKYTELGDLAFGYVMAYGVIRAFLEPLRSASYNMGENGYWSWIFSCLFIVFGALGIFGNHLIRHLLRKKKNELRNDQETFNFSKIMLFVGGCLSLVFLTLSIIFMAGKSPNLNGLTYDLFNLGVIFLCLGVGSLLLTTNSLIYFLEIKKAGVLNNEQI